MKIRIALLLVLCATVFSGSALAQESATKGDHAQQNEAAGQKSIKDPQFTEALRRGDLAGARKIMLRNGAYSTVVIGVVRVRGLGASGEVFEQDNKYCLLWSIAWLPNPSPPPSHEAVFMCTRWSDEVR